MVRPLPDRVSPYYSHVVPITIIVVYPSLFLPIRECVVNRIDDQRCQ